MKNFLHERRRRGCLEVVRDVLLKDAGRERPKLFAKLDLEIDNVAHVRPTRVGKERTVAQSASAEFHSALKPANNLAIAERVHDPVE